MNPLAIAALIVWIAALSVTILPKLFDKGNNSGVVETLTPSGSDLTVHTDEIGTQASFFDYDADGITVQVLAEAEGMVCGGQMKMLI